MTNALMQDLQTVHDALMRFPQGPFRDMDGSFMHVDPSDAEVALLRRGEMLTDLMHLREPVMDRDAPQRTQIETDFTSDWAFLAYFKSCPCPGVPRHMWDHEFDDADAVGQMMGRNK